MTPPEPQTPDVVELLPCPFCGGEAKSYPIRGLSGYVVDCLSCGSAAHESDPQRARLLWNTRHREQPAIVGGVDREALALALARADGLRRQNKYAENAYKAGVGVTIDYWNALADAALTARPSAPAEVERPEAITVENTPEDRRWAMRQNWQSGDADDVRGALTEAAAPAEVADDGGQSITDAARRMVAAQGMDWSQLDGSDIGYWESLAAEALNSTPAPVEPGSERAEEFAIGDRVEKVSGSSWRGIVIGIVAGIYRTELTPESYAVESEREPFSVQIYSAKSLARLAADDAK